MAGDKLFATYFDCDDCSKEERKNRGCKRPLSKKLYPEGVWRIDECWVCGGKNERCPICKGNNRIPVNRCPRSMVGGLEFALLPYFFQYYAGIQNGRIIWPDGRGTLFQPIKLRKAFDIMLPEYAKIVENAGKDKDG